MPRYSSYGHVEAPDVFGNFLAGKQARQQNDLAEIDMQKRQKLNALSQDPAATPEQYVRAGDVQTGAALQGMQQSQAAGHQQAVQELASLVKRANIANPQQAREFTRQIAQQYGQHFKTMGVDLTKSLGELDSTPDEVLMQRLQQVAQFAPQEKPISVAAGGSLVDPSNPSKPLYTAPNPGQEETSRHNRAMEANARPPANFRAMSPEEVAKAGLPPGTAAQIDGTGKIDVMTKRDTTGVLSQKDSTVAKIKLNTLALARQQLNKIRESFTEGTQGVNAFGPTQGYLPTQAGKKFDARVNQMRSTLTALTRVPGVGAMSDYETKLDQSKFPERSAYESVTADTLNNLDDQLSLIETGYKDLLSGGNSQSQAPSAPQAPAAGGGPVRVSSPQEAMSLPPGTQFMTPDGRVKVRP